MVNNYTENIAYSSSKGLDRYELLILMVLGLLTLSTISSYQALIPSFLIAICSLRWLPEVIFKLLTKLSPRIPSGSPGRFRSPSLFYTLFSTLFSALFSKLPELIKADFNASSLQWRLLGIILPIASIFPKGALTLSVITCLILDRSKRSPAELASNIIGTAAQSKAEVVTDKTSHISALRPISVFTPYLIVCLSWIALAAFYEFPFFYLKNLVGLLSFYPEAFFSLSKLTPVTASLIEGMAPFLLLLIIWGRLSEDTQKGRALLGGILLSWAIALSWVVLQAVGITQAPFRRNSDFWLQQGRFWGTFPDPNAFGVFSIVLISIVASIELNKKLKVLFVLTTSFVSLLSGSRSFVMGLFILGLLWVYERRVILRHELAASARRRDIFKLFLVATIVLSFFLAILKPSSLERVLLSINPETAAASFFSRAIFWKSCLWIWFNNPVIGGGLGSFRETFPQAVEHFGLDLNGWTDNANNFYLGILAEQGLLGLITLLCALMSLRWRKACRTPLQRAPLLISALLLFFGPHLEFMEVAILMGLVFSVTIIAPRNIGLTTQIVYKLGLRLAIVGVILVLASERERDYGVFAPIKRSGDVKTFEKPFWIAPKASIVRPCLGGKIKLVVTDDRSAEALKHRCFGGDANPNLISVSTSSQSSTLEVLNGAKYIELDCDGGLQRISITSSTPWIPALSRGGRDSRFLGVKVSQKAQH